MKYPIRSQIIAPKDFYLLACDLSQAEAWVVAYKARDVHMKGALTDKRPGFDIHSQTGRIVNDLPFDAPVTKEQRYAGKKSNHALNYRMKAEQFARVINKEGLMSVTTKQTRIWYNKYHSFYNVKLWWAEIEQQLNINRTITTCYGRRRVFYGQWGDELFKVATAFEPQSTVADHMFGAIHPELGIAGGMLGVYRNIVKGREREIRITNTAHDSILLEVHKSIDVKEISDQVLQQLERPIVINGEQFTIPADAEWGERWGEMEKL